MLTHLWVYSGMAKSKRPKSGKRQNPNKNLCHFSDIRLRDFCLKPNNTTWDKKLDLFLYSRCPKTGHKSVLI